ncbi:CGNR zinc finger domain-containing protein [Silvibacterium acidisoli]|uniref:CGNR zinc finger domain-containing protein n=1 Tax=Acidobacteriaceae bacterium ZG23-2 TaxID=2883246 RepID=UPI00406CFCA1
MKKAANGSRARVASDVDHLGGHIAINFLNTSRMQDGVLAETLQTDSDVRAWMKSMRVSEPALDKPLKEGALLFAARHLRDVMLEAVQLKKAGKRIVPRELNRLLALSTSHLSLNQVKDNLQIVRSYHATNPIEFLAPVTEEIAELLANGNFDLIRQCEGDVCVLWFLDQTKSHKRRWCNAETCGTRARVAAFRARKAAVSGKK